jgi:DNA-directed RNA polymerase subunit RPC12/RpoP
VSETTCPHCGEPVEPRQLVCLNCGGRVALKERTPLAREPVTAVAAVLVATIVIGAGLFGFAISELTSGDGDDPAPRQERAATPATEEEPAAQQGAEEEPAAEAPAVVGGEDQPTRTAPADPGRVPGWPKGLTAHTVVLVTSSDRAAALGVAREARSRGLEAGLMRSDPYDLGTGLWIVYTGHFTTPEGAGRQASELTDRYPGAYPQLVQSSQ